MSVPSKRQQTNNEKLMARLEDLNLTQDELAKFVGVRRATVSTWVKGGIPRLQPIQVLRLAVVLNCTLDDLVEMFQPSELRSLHHLRKEFEALKKKT
ncbi:putative transcriptional regulator [Oscillatoria acuminata PCC 6304]|uniref:Putative transcriptional regulator n=2 Tax=Oscillatoria acuminata TaxID=118323 RepID=K9TDH2_9CYAN|nr:putative transcriptional regulator [Oscillatoria acuminata PCC 6304]